MLGFLYQKSNEDDSQIHDKVKEGNERTGLHPEKLYADTNYISGLPFVITQKMNKS